MWAGGEWTILTWSKKKKKIRVNIAKTVILKAIIIFSTETY